MKSYLKKGNVAPTQLYLVWIRHQRKISFVMSFTISNWLKKYYLAAAEFHPDTKKLPYGTGILYQYTEIFLFLSQD